VIPPGEHFSSSPRLPLPLLPHHATSVIFLLAFLAPPGEVDLTSTELRVILPMSNVEADYEYTCAGEGGGGID